MYVCVPIWIGVHIAPQYCKYNVVGSRTDFINGWFEAYEIFPRCSVVYRRAHADPVMW